MSDALQILSDFDTVSRELAATRELLAGVPDEMRSLHEEYTAARAHLDALEAEAAGARSRRSEAEMAIADAQEKLKRYQSQVPQVRNQREYGALLSEIDTVKATIKRLEEQALAAIEQVDTATAAHTDESRNFAELETRYQAGMAEWEARKPEVARRAAELEARRGELAAALSRGVVAQYERLAERYHGVALATLARADTPSAHSVWFCASCNFQVRPQVAVEIRTRGVIIQCESCRRFLRAESAE